MRVELPQYSPCDGCGRCCEYIGLPPFEVANPLLGPSPVKEFRANPDVILIDMQVMATMPRELLESHAATIRSLDGPPQGKPCAWYDAETKRCRNYDWRPASCRLFEVEEYRCESIKAGCEVQWRWDDEEVELWANPRGRVPDPSVDALYADIGGSD